MCSTFEFLLISASDAYWGTLSGMSDKRAFGTPSGRKLFEVYDSRLELSEAGLHRLPQEDVCGTGDFGCESFLVSGRYVAFAYELVH